MKKQEQGKRRIPQTYFQSDGSYDQFIEPDVETESWEALERPISEQPDAYEEEKYHRES